MPRAPTAPPNMVFVMQPIATPMMVQHKARLVICGIFLPREPDTAPHNFNVTAMRLSIAWGVPSWNGGCEDGIPPCIARGWKVR